MKRIERVLTILLLIFMASALYLSVSNEDGVKQVFTDAASEPKGTWVTDVAEKEVRFEYQLPETSGSDSEEMILLLRTHWLFYKIDADGEEIYHTNSFRNGKVHLYQIPAGSDLVIHFLGGNNSTIHELQKSEICLGTKNGIYSMIIQNNLYVIIFMAIAVLLGFTSICVGIYMKSVWTKEMCRSLISLGIYILCAGIWILTDSQLLLLVTQQSELVEVISFLAFFFLPIPLLEFTKGILPEKETTLSVFQKLFFVVLLIYSLNYIFRIVSVSVVIVTGHILMAVTILLILYSGLLAIKKKRSKKLFRLMTGYVIFSICSTLAFIFFYKGESLKYSIAYTAGIMGFIFFLGEVACYSVYEQMKENANLAIHARMAYQDMMTGLGNRTAFLKEKEENESYAGRLGYIMLDANNLKKTNDNFGHQRGDELIQKIAECIRKVVADAGKCYRIGGDEFVVCLKGYTKEETQQCMIRIQKEIQLVNEQSDIEISAAAGCAWTEKREKETEHLLAEADARMYKNKEQMKRTEKNVL